MPAGSAIGHAAGNIPITINRITGPVIKLNDSTFRLNPQAGYWENPHSYELWFAATHPGDAEYKPAVQQSLMIVQPHNATGKEQHITFLPVPNQKPHAKGIKLHASSDAQSPVGFYVLEGPVELSGNTLNIAAIPPHSRFPVKVTVVAWQYGNSHEPKLQTAVPAEQSFLLKNNLNA
ncbi:hypothetical protein ACFJIV_27135 [Mucilaginibacter sp. UC70_90]